MKVFLRSGPGDGGSQVDLGHVGGGEALVGRVGPAWQGPSGEQQQRSMLILPCQLLPLLLPLLFLSASATVWLPFSVALLIKA